MRAINLMAANPVVNDLLFTAQIAQISAHNGSKFVVLTLYLGHAKEPQLTMGRVAERTATNHYESYQ